jgi:O-antigen/teichoic acid export membrane protein
MMLRLFNAGLRLGSLAMKLGLTLYMGKYLGLAELGTYGLVASFVAIAIPLLGFRFDYIVSRDVVDETPLMLAQKMRDQMAFYVLNYVGLGLLFAAGTMIAPGKVSLTIALFTVILCILENLATITTSNLVSLKRPILANSLFFIRAALWVIPVVALGYFNPAYRNAETVLAWWTGGIVLSLVINGFVWRHLPWGEVLETAVNWEWIKKGVKGSIFIWLGAVGAAAAGVIDRFVVEFYLGREYVGITSFYGSFVVAIAGLVGSGVYAFSYPHLISLHKEGNSAEFRHTLRKMTMQALMSGGFMALIIGLTIPWLGNNFDRPEFAEHAPVLWLMLVGIWIRSGSESLYYAMYARHQDTAIWVGSLLQLAVAFVCNVILLHFAGFIGIGYSAVITAILLTIWRVYWVKNYKMPGMN